MLDHSRYETLRSLLEVPSHPIAQTSALRTRVDPREQRLSKSIAKHQKLADELFPSSCKIRSTLGCTKTHLRTPSKDVRCANMNAERLHILIPGIGTFPDGHLRAGQIIANKVAAPVTVIENSTSRLRIRGLGIFGKTLGDLGALRDLVHGAFGLWSPEAGRSTEPVAVNGLMQAVRSHVVQKNQPMVLHSYSQGAIITQNALRLLKEDLSPKEWKKLRSNLQVEAYGAALGGWPKGLRVVCNQYTFDMPAVLMGFAYRAFHPFSRSSHTKRKAYLHGFSHDLVRYSKDNSEFFLAAHSEKHIPHALIHSIRNGLMSNREHQSILRKAFSADPVRFSRSFLEAVDSKEGLGQFSPKLIEQMRFYAKPWYERSFLRFRDSIKGFFSSISTKNPI